MAAATVTGLSWSPASDQIAAFTQAGQLFILKIDSVGSIREVHIGAKRIISMCWSRDSTYLNIASLREDSEHETLVLQCWNASNGDLISSLQNPAWDKAYAAFSSQQRFLGLALQKELVQVWDLQTLKMIGDFEAPHTNLFSLDCSPDGKTIALGWENGWIDIWLLDDVPIQSTFHNHRNSVFSLSFSNSGRLLASRSLDQRLFLWNCADWSIVGRLDSPCSKDNPVECAFQPCGSKFVVTGSQDRVLEVWDINEEVLLNNKTIQGMIIKQIKVDKMDNRITIEGNGNVIALGSNNLVKNTTTLSSAATSSNLEQLLNELIKEIDKLHDHASTETVESMTNDAKSLKREASSKAPRVEKVRGFVNDLKKAATDLAEIGEPILQIILKILPVLLINS